MDKYVLKRKRGQSSSENASDNIPQPSSTSLPPTGIDLSDLPWDPAERKKKSEYHPNQRDEIRRRYLIMGPCQPREHNFPLRMIGTNGRRFSLKWFNQFGNWLEYSIKEDKAYCLCCYLFKDGTSKKGGGDAFVTEGFCSWKKSERLSLHVGNVNSSHYIALKKCEDLMRQNQSIATAIQKQNDVAKNEYRIRLNASVDASRYLLKCALPFHGHDESEISLFRGNFLELLNLIREQNETVCKVTLNNAPGNNQMKALIIQKDIAHCFAQEILKSIFEEIGNEVFALLVDESSDVSKKEQMAVVLRYVTHGIVKERFIGLVHVKETSASSLKSAIDSLF